MKELPVDKLENEPKTSQCFNFIDLRDERHSKARPWWPRSRSYGPESHASTGQHMNEPIEFNHKTAGDKSLKSQSADRCVQTDLVI